MPTITLPRELNAATDSVAANQGSPGATPWPVLNQAQLVPDAYDDIRCTYTNGNVTQVVYALQGVTVATVACSYDTSGNLTRVTRS